VDEHLDATELLQKLESSVTELHLHHDMLLSTSDQFQSCMQDS
jgi:hypothetical protein